MVNRIFFIVVLLFSAMVVRAQEFNSKVTVISGQISSKIDKKIFQTLQTGLTNFINNRKWTSSGYQQQEKIVCNFILTLNQEIETNVYRASLTIQAARPVYNSSYIAPLINFMDNDVAFKYVEFQPLEFNENRVQGSDPLASNLTAVFAFYAYMILGLDHDSFSPRGGDPHFQKARFIVTSAPDDRNISGWNAFDQLRNRYWLSENFTNSKYSLIHDALYLYYRLGMDKMYEDENEARQQVLNSLNTLNTLSSENPNLFVVQFFFLGKTQELIGLYRKAAPQEKQRVADLLQRLDISNGNQYRQALK